MSDIDTLVLALLALSAIGATLRYFTDHFFATERSSVPVMKTLLNVTVFSASVFGILQIQNAWPPPNSYFAIALLGINLAWFTFRNVFWWMWARNPIPDRFFAGTVSMAALLGILRIRDQNHP